MSKVFVEISARHIHLSEEHVAKLFGEGHKLTIKKELSQPGQFACEEKVTVVGPRGEIKMSVLGPERANTQIEITLTEARQLGVEALVRESGKIEGTTGCKLVGPCGEVEISEGIIAAKRHIHVSPEVAKENGIKNGDVVKVEVKTAERSLIFGDVVVRESAAFAPGMYMHVDTDEANAAGMKGLTEGDLVL